MALWFTSEMCTEFLNLLTIAIERLAHYMCNKIMVCSNSKLDTWSKLQSKD